VSAVGIFGSLRGTTFVGLGAALVVFGTGATARAQASAAFPADPPAAPAPAAPAPTPPPAQLAPAAVPAEPQPALPPPSYTPPPGYKLVPIQAPADANVWTPPPGAYPPLELPYTDGQTVPPGYEVVSRNRMGLVVAGTITTTVMWIFSVTAAVMSEGDDQSGYLAIPVLGPWLMIATGGTKDECTNDGDLTSCENKAPERGLVVFDGLVQLGGAAMIASGFLFPSKHLVRTNLSLRLRPMTLGRNGHGLGILGTF
jgi:hypothetical protein